MRIAVDMDDTLIDFMAHVIACLNNEYGTDLQKSSLTTWKNTALDGIFENGQTWWDWVRQHDWIWTKVPAIPGAIGGIHTLRQRGHRIELVTSKPEWAEWVVWAWLGKWRPAVHSVTIVFKEPKWVVSDAQLLIDDGPHNVEPWVEYAGRRAILFDQPWNQDVKEGPRLIRASNWPEVVEIVKGLKEEPCW